MRSHSLKLDDLDGLGVVVGSGGSPISKAFRDVCGHVGRLVDVDEHGERVLGETMLHGRACVKMNREVRERWVSRATELIEDAPGGAGMIRSRSPSSQSSNDTKNSWDSGSSICVLRVSERLVSVEMKRERVGEPDETGTYTDIVDGGDGNGKITTAEADGSSSDRDPVRGLMAGRGLLGESLPPRLGEKRDRHVNRRR